MSRHHRTLGRDQHRLKLWILRHRARYRCEGEECGRRIGMSRFPRSGVSVSELHHTVPLSQGGFHVKSNVELLCRGCHIKVHQQKKFLELSPERRAWVQHLSSY